MEQQSRRARLGFLPAYRGAHSRIGTAALTLGIGESFAPAEKFAALLSLTGPPERGVSPPSFSLHGGVA